MSTLHRRRLALQLEREELRLRCAAQRSAWAAAGPAALPGLRWAVQAEAGARLASRWLRAHPALAATAVAAGLLLLRPRRLAGWAGTLLTLWSLWQRAQPLVAAFAPPKEDPPPGVDQPPPR